MGFWGSKPPAPPGQGGTNESIVGGGATPIVPETKAEVVAQGDDQKSDSSGAGGCPMHRADGSYSFDVRALWRMGFPHAPGGSHPLTPEQARSSAANETSPIVEPAPTPSATKPSSGGGCPVKQKSNNASAHQHHPEYNVYAQAIDPTNQMPFQPNQLPAPTQSVPLSTERVASTIPKVR
jgi:Cytochrome c/c1 heme lyase